MVFWNDARYNTHNHFHNVMNAFIFEFEKTTNFRLRFYINKNLISSYYFSNLPLFILGGNPYLFNADMIFFHREYSNYINILPLCRLGFYSSSILLSFIVVSSNSFNKDFKSFLTFHISCHSASNVLFSLFDSFSVKIKHSYPVI